MADDSPVTSGDLLTGSGWKRTVAPSDTVERLRPHLRRIGITRVADVTGMDTIGIPTVIVVRPNARSLSVSQGKGFDLDIAKASGIMESIEQHVAETIDRPLCLSSLHDLDRRCRVVDVNRLPRYVKRFNPDARLLWIEGADLSSGEAVWVPYEMVHLDFTLPLPGGSGCFQPGSNGLASGNQGIEAVLHGLYEVIERDAVALFYGLSASEQWQRRLELGGVGDATCRALLRRYDMAGIDVGIWDTTSDTAIPSFFCSVIDRELNSFRPVGVARGSACHSDKGIALCRALCEAAQSRLTRIVGSRDDIQHPEIQCLRTQEALRRARAEVALGTQPPRAQPPRRYADIPVLELGGPEDELAWVLARLQAVDLGRPVAVDLSTPDLPASVVRVVVPGLEAPAEVPGYQPGERARRAKQLVGNA